jgi:hypothetical protein
MRIIDEFNADDVKVTVFKMNDKISIKFEYNLLEQIYKFRDGSGVSSPEMVKKFCTEETISEIKVIFNQMSHTRSKSLTKLFEINTEDHFDTII